MEKEKILIVDDEEHIRKILSRKLEILGYNSSTLADGRKVILEMKNNRYNLVLLDIDMPYMSGTKVLSRLKAIDSDIPVVMISALNSLNLVRSTLREGAYDYLVKPLDFEEFELTIKRALEHGRLVLRNREYKDNLEKEVEERTRELADALKEIKRTYNATILALGSALETRDIETKAHALRVAHYSQLIAKSIGIDDIDFLTGIERGSYLHDIGKIGVPDHILRKPDSLTDEEWQVMKKHPEIGKRMIGGIDFLRGAVPIVFSHHERFDGSGYPQGLKGEDIPLGARIFSVADSLDAMISDRPYRKALSLSAARNIILDESEKQFDPEVVKAFAKIPDEKLLGNESDNVKIEKNIFPIEV